MRVELMVCVLSYTGLAFLVGWGAGQWVLKWLRGPEELVLYRPWRLSESSQWKLLAAGRKLVEAWDSWRMREEMGVDSGPAFNRLSEAKAELEKSFWGRQPR